VVDNSLGANIRREFDVTLSKDIEILGNEVVSFAIIDRPFTDVTSGNTISFQMNCQAEANYGFFPIATDAFAESLMEDKNQESYDPNYQDRRRQGAVYYGDKG